MQIRYIAILVLLGAIWGSSLPFVRLALESFSPLTVVALRLSGSALPALAAILARSVHRGDGRIGDLHVLDYLGRATY